MNAPATNILCSSGRFCRECRTPVREIVRRLVILPSLRSPASGLAQPPGDDNFECPYGKAWIGVAPGHEVNEARRLLDEQAEGKAAVCGACEQFGTRTESQIGPKVYCRAVPGCCGGGLGTVSLYYGQCPKGLWPEDGSNAGNG